MSKIFCIGSNKTGTTSLTNALQILGYNICPEYIIFSSNYNYLHEQKNGLYNSLFELVKKYDVFEDRPWNHTDFYKVLDINFPNSKFILTLRNSENWINSYRRYCKKTKLREKWFYKLVSQVCYGNDDFLSDETTMKDKYNNRNEDIIKYFENTNKLLILNLEESPGWNPLCDFLDKQKPNLEFPHLNRTK